MRIDRSFGLPNKFVVSSPDDSNTEISEVTSDDIIINKAEDGVDLLGNIYCQGFDKCVINEKNITSDFFELLSAHPSLELA